MLKIAELFFLVIHILGPSLVIYFENRNFQARYHYSVLVQSHAVALCRNISGLSQLTIINSGHWYLKNKISSSNANNINGSAAEVGE